MGPYLVQGAWFPNRLLLEGTDLYPDFWAITGGPRYLGYMTLTVAPEPSIKRVIGAVHPTGSRIGTHMSLRVPSRDSVVWPWG
jgi:hypothetical protein